MAEGAPQEGGVGGQPGIRLLAVDLDGTLITPGGHGLSQANAAALAAARQRGVRVAPASGRPTFGIDYLFEGRDFYDLMIAYNGACIYDKDSGRALFSQPVEPAAAVETIRLALEYDMPLSCFIGETFYVRRASVEATFEARALGRLPVVQPDLTGLADRGIHKLLTLSLDDLERLDVFYRAAVSELPGVRAMYTAPNCVEFIHPQASKGAALKYLMDLLGLEARQVLAVGDSYNDLSMFACAGVSVAMGNAPAEVKEAATWVAPDVEENGAAAAIERYILT